MEAKLRAEGGYSETREQSLDVLARASETLRRSSSHERSTSSLAYHIAASHLTDGSVASDESGDRQSLPPLAEVPQSQDFFGDSSTFTFVSKVTPEVTDGETLPSKRGLSAASPFRESQYRSTPTAHEEALCFELPPRELADSLLDAYFSRAHRLYPFVHEPTFRAEYERLWVSPRPPAKQLRPEIFGILNIIFANGCEFYPVIPRDQVLSVAADYVARAKSLVIPRAVQAGSLEQVQALLIMCHYLQGTLELNECWNLVGLMIRTAIAIGLHLNPPKHNISTIEREIRKRVWWGCIIIDRTLSMKYGRPPSVRATDVFEVDLPLNVDDQYITEHVEHPRQPHGRHSYLEFYRQTIKMSPIIGKILRDLYQMEFVNDPVCSQKDFSVSLSNTSRVLGCTVHLDGELLAWWEEIPDYLRIEPTVSDGADFERQRRVLSMRYLNMRLLVHRQAFLLFVREDIQDEYQRVIALASARICIQASRQTIRVICTQYHRRVLNALTYNLHYIFTAMGVLLTLQNLEESKFAALNVEPDMEALRWGMQFLKDTSNESPLSARYVIMLQKMQRRPLDSSSSDLSVPSTLPFTIPTTTSVDVAQLNHGANANNLLNGSMTVSAQQQSFLGANESDWQARVDQTEYPVFDTEFGGYSHLLTGTGLPRDFVATQWSSDIDVPM
ncbi:fungal-specific transcription factor domain-containing protein [Xylogone sp. PMI_703]|nr:fungal-specific transcription factor domain-containing protein [Xylogone sp. PMI_703]